MELDTSGSQEFGNTEPVNESDHANVGIPVFQFVI